MNPLLLSLAAGVLIGLLYGLLKVRSPAPPAIALVGLLGGALVHAVLPAEHATTLQQSDAPFVTPVSRVS
jgi:XapX domain-containing protein